MLRLHIGNFYHSSYETMGLRNFQHVLDQCPRLESDDMNMALMLGVMSEEMKEMVFQMGATKAPGPDWLNGHWMMDSFLTYFQSYS